PYETVERSQRTREVSLLEAATLALQLNRHVLEQSGIDAAIVGGDFRVRARPASPVQILDNLVHNACHWVAQLPDGDLRRVAVILDPAGRRVLVADSGPGIHEEAGEQVFEPFFTMRSGGRGLGLYISSELARGMRAKLRLADPTDREFAGSWAT